MLLLLIIFLVGCAAAAGAAGACAAYNISTEADRGTHYRFFLLRLRYHYCCFLWVNYIAVADVEK